MTVLQYSGISAVSAALLSARFGQIRSVVGAGFEVRRFFKNNCLFYRKKKHDFNFIIIFHVIDGCCIQRFMLTIGRSLRLSAYEQSYLVWLP